MQGVRFGFDARLFVVKFGDELVGFAHTWVLRSVDSVPNSCLSGSGYCEGEDLTSSEL